MGELLGGGFTYFLFSPRTLGKIPILTNIFQGGWNHQLDYYSICPDSCQNWGWSDIKQLKARGSLECVDGMAICIFWVTVKYTVVIKLPSSSSSLYIWNQGSSYLIYWLEDQGYPFWGESNNTHLSHLLLEREEYTRDTLWQTCYSNENMDQFEDAWCMSYQQDTAGIFRLCPPFSEVTHASLVWRNNFSVKDVDERSCYMKDYKKLRLLR